MIRSMTGFGTAAVNLPSKTITVEIKSVNSKFFDLTLRLPAQYREKELELRAELNRFIERGKVECTIGIESQEAGKRTSVNLPLLKAYDAELQTAQKALGLKQPDNYFQILLGLPEVLVNERNSLAEEEWNALLGCLQEAMHRFDEFRKNEGKALGKDLSERIAGIGKGLAALEPYEAGRIEQVRKRLQGSLDEFIEQNNLDRNRFEQELIFYIEKFDISEEKVRLRSHLDYFTKVLKGEQSSGKKLGFIGQEIGREINTIGSKANDAAMQQVVVGMKDELEKIKEQVLNVL